MKAFIKDKIVDVSRPSVAPDQILVKTVAMAANPTDWKHFKYLGAQGIAGSDASGIVVEIGEKVVGFKVGDAVASWDHGNVDQRGKFAEYHLANPAATIKLNIEDNPLEEGVYSSSKITSFEAAASIPLGLATVAVLFTHNLQISGPGTILIWGGATATGILAIQVAKKVYGLTVLTTCSPKHFEFMKKIGADVVYDYHEEFTIDREITWALDTVSMPETVQRVYDLCDDRTVALDNLLGVKPEGNKDIRLTFTLVYNALGETVEMMGVAYESTPELVEQYNEFWREKVPGLVDQLYTANLVVLPAGLASASTAFQMLESGTQSAQKVVFRQQ